jgi:hypothetical protein
MCGRSRYLKFRLRLQAPNQTEVVFDLEQDQASDINISKTKKVYILFEKLCKQMPNKLKSDPESKLLFKSEPETKD